MAHVSSKYHSGPDLVLHESGSVDFGNMAAGAEDTQTMAVPGAAIGDGVTVNPRAALEQGIVIKQAFVSAANTVSMIALNTTAGAVNPAAVVCDVYVTKQEL